MLTVASLALASGAGDAHADGGALRFSGTCGPYEVAVFTEPTPLRAGPVDLSVFVQDAETGRVVDGAEISVTLRRDEAPTGALRAAATRGAATNKLLYAAHADLPDAGTWNVKIQIHGQAGQADAELVLVAGPPLPRVVELWPWLGLPVACSALFGFHQWLVARAARFR